MEKLFFGNDKVLPGGEVDDDPVLKGQLRCEALGGPRGPRPEATLGEVEYVIGMTPVGLPQKL
jgi:hypothetical protein